MEEIKLCFLISFSTITFLSKLTPNINIKNEKAYLSNVMSSKNSEKNLDQIKEIISKFRLKINNKQTIIKTNKIDKVRFWFE